MTFLNKSLAFDYVARLLHSKYDCWYNVLPVNVGRHSLLRPQKPSNPVFYALFKREWMYEFNRMFQKFVRDSPDMKGLGESINKEWLDYSIRAGTDYLLFIYPDHTIYLVPPMLIKKFCEKNNLIRTQRKTNDYKIPDFSESIEQINELTYCFPVKLLTKLDEVKI